MWDSVITFGDIAEPMYKTWENGGYGKRTSQKFVSLDYDLFFIDGEYTLTTNALITDEHSTVTGK